MLADLFMSLTAGLEKQPIRCFGLRKTVARLPAVVKGPGTMEHV